MAVGVGVPVGIRVGVGVGATVGVGDAVGTPVGVGLATEVGPELGVAIGVGVAVGVEVAGGVGIAVGVGATTPLPAPRSSTVAVAFPLDASLPIVTVVVNTALAGGANDTIAVALACGASTVPAAGSMSIEKAGEGFIVSVVMVSGALPRFSILNLACRVATRPKRSRAGATTNLLNTGVGRA